MSQPASDGGLLRAETALLPAIASGMPQLDTIYNLDALTMLKAMPDECINCIITSPPYWGLRSYLPDGHMNKHTEMGSEPTLVEFIKGMVILFREARRVLRSDGVMWLNMGDCYATSANGRSAAETKAIGEDDRTFRDKPFSTVGNGLKPKDLVGQPWRLALALQDDGWWLRSDCIWHKPNPMPASVKDRPTTAHEYVFLMTKSPNYYFDPVPMQTPVKIHSIKRLGRAVSEGHKNANGAPGQTPHSMNNPRPNRKQDGAGNRQYTGFNERYDGEAVPMAHPRTVWSIPTVGFKGAHFATFPDALIRPLIDAGCPGKVCNCCGKPYERVEETERFYEHTTTAHGKSKIGPYASQTGNGLGTHDIRHGVINRSVTIGFEPTCTCGTGTGVGVVYDPFMGSGTTALVARSLGRRYIGSELNAEYIKIANDRLRMPFEGKQVKAKEPDMSDLPLFEKLTA